VQRASGGAEMLWNTKRSELPAVWIIYETQCFLMGVMSAGSLCCKMEVVTIPTPPVSLVPERCD
jgi:hypothetical protein